MHTTPTRTELLPWRDIDGRVVILHPSKGDVHELDEVGAFLWKSATGERTLEQIVTELTGIFEVDEAEARADAEAFYSELRGHGLLR
jgi:hypothetical protein